LAAAAGEGDCTGGGANRLDSVLSTNTESI